MAESRLRLMIIDDHAVVRKGLSLVLRLEPDFEIVPASQIFNLSKSSCVQPEFGRERAQL